MHVTPYLNFNGHCREAFAHYQRVLGGELMLMTYSQMPQDTRDDGCADVSAAAPDQVMHVTLAAGEAPLLMGSDMPPGQHAPGGSNIAVALNFDDNAEAERVFAALAEGGQIGMPMEETFWAERFGMCVDRFGIQWLVNGRYQQS
ncbi:VOC family protein [Xanthomonas campestris]|uniref:VOC family protein n=1 Tax=Xanthomonas campestris TaxID=339 RepID=UPI0023E994C6|nr:PhnB protein [Xanthomonas campestris]